jgi:Ca2+-binding RTX toxin-like protein
MATYALSSISNGTVINFNPATDIFDVNLASSPVSLEFEFLWQPGAVSNTTTMVVHAGDISFSIVGLSPVDITTANFVFSTTGGVFMLGDNAVSGAGNGDLTGSHTVSGTGFADLLVSLDAVDTLNGGEGNDNLVLLASVAPSADTVNGGGGYDLLSFYVDPGSPFLNNLAVVANLGANTLSWGGVTLGMSGIEAIEGGDGNDSLTGSTQSNEILGSGGNDTLNGDGGADTLDGGDGNDSLDGGLGNDTLYGGSGQDQLQGGDGNDLLEGGTENDYLAGGNGDDRLRGGLGNDAMDGGAGYDTLDYTDHLATSGGYTFSLSYQVANGSSNMSVSGRGTNAGYNESDFGIFNIEQIDGTAGNDVIRDLGEGREIYFRGARGNDHLVGSPFDGVLDYAVYSDLTDSNVHIEVDLDWSFSGYTSGGFTGNLAVVSGAALGSGGTLTEVDRLEGIGGILGSAGSDLILGSARQAEYFRPGQGNDTVDGRAGFDIVDYNSAVGDLSIMMAEAGQDTIVNDGSGGTDTLRNIEAVYGGGLNDLLVGNSGDNRLRGRSGSDTLDGAGGFDVADYRSASAALTITLAGSTVDTVDVSDGQGGLDRLRNIEGLRGGTGNDRLNGNEVANLLDGGDGEDTLMGGLGNDTLDGQAGFDQVWYDYLNDSQGYTFTHNHVAGTVTVHGQGSNAATTETDTLRSIDLVKGSGAADLMVDAVAGRNVYFMGGLGNDEIQGNASDTDFAVYSERSAAVTANLGAGTVSVAGQDTDTLIGIRGIWGGSGNDSLAGGTANEYFRGNGGNDTIDGGDGMDIADFRANNTNQGIFVTLLNATDTLVIDQTGGTDTLRNIEGISGSLWADTITGNNANNWLRGRAGNDTINGGDGVDTVVHNTATSAVFADIASLSATSGNISDGEGGYDTVSNVENIVGGDYNDTLRGGNGANQIDGGAGDDWLMGREGNDTLNGGSGFDYLEYSYLTHQDGYNFVVTSNAVAITGKGGNAGYAETDTISSIDVVYGSAGADSMTDTVAGRQSYFVAGTGNDTITGNIQDGDAVSYWDRGSNIRVNLNLALNTVVVTDLNNGTYSETDTLVGINNAYGGSGNDTLTGNTLNNYLRGAGGNDTIDGGAGFDTAAFSNAVQGVRIVLAEAGVDTIVTNDGLGGSDVLRNIEGIDASNYDDYIVGNSASNSLRGRVGYDYLDGGGGLDWADYAGAESAVSITLAESGTTFANDGWGSVDQLVNIEGLFGTDHSDTLIGNAHNNVFRGRAGNDTINGMGGSDIVNYQGAAGGLSITLAAGGAEIQVEDGDGGVDTLRNIESLYGTNFNDSLTGNELANELRGNMGADSLQGGNGDDTLVGGAGDDSLAGGEGTDTAAFSGQRAVYTILRGMGTVTVSGVDGTDVLSGIERLRFDDGEMLLKPVDNDFDGDGMSDIAWRNSSSGDNLVWRSANNTTKVSVASRADQNFKIAAIADFDGDGKSDLFWRNTASGANEIWKTGNSATIQAVTTVSDMAWKLLGTGDFDGDGKADLFWRNASTGANLVWKSANNATQIAVTTVTDMAWSFQGTGDFDGDGKSDLLWRNTSTGDNLIWKSANNATKLVPTTVADQAWKIVGVGDFDGDGKSDILWRNASTGANTIWKAANSATVQATSALDLAWTVMGTGDYGGDGKSDILWRNASTGANMVWSSGNSATVQPVTTVTDMAWRVVPAVEAATTVRRAAMDFDGDGKSDIVWRNTASGLDTIWKSGNSATTQTMTTVTDMAWKVAGIADFDADGRADILWRNTSTGANTIWKSANNATQQATTARADQNFKVLGTGDFDGDGKADILWRNLATGANEIWKSGNSATVQAMTTVTDMAWKVVGTGDFDADGKTDVLWRNTSTGANTIWKSANNATQQAVTARADQNFNVLGTADFDGDGKADILWRNLATGANEIWKSGNSATVQAVTPVTDMAWRIVGTGDFDGDGKSDILWRNASTGANTIWKSANNATQQATTAQPDQDWSIVDGLETGDLLFGGAGANTLLGTANNDTLFGAAGNDTLTGGLGNDTFRFSATNQGTDSITDFLPGSDKLLFVNTAFGNLAQGTLHAGNFVSGAAPAPTQAAPQFLYNSATGQLAFDADGTGGGVAVNIVSLVGAPALGAADILLGG